MIHEFVVDNDDVFELATLKDFSSIGYAHSLTSPTTLIISGGTKNNYVKEYTFGVKEKDKTLFLKSERHIGYLLQRRS